MLCQSLGDRHGRVCLAHLPLSGRGPKSGASVRRLAHLVFDLLFHAV